MGHHAREGQGTSIDAEVGNVQQEKRPDFKMSEWREHTMTKSRLRKEKERGDLEVSVWAKCCTAAKGLGR